MIIDASAGMMNNMRTKKLRGYPRKWHQAYFQGEKSGIQGHSQEFCNPYNTTNEYGLRCAFHQGQQQGLIIKDWFDNGCQMGTSITTMMYDRSTVVKQ